MAEVRWWRKWWVWLIAVGVVLVGLGIAGVVALASTFLGFAHDVVAEDESRQPFELALDDLAQTSVVHYQGAAADGIDYDLRVTADGDAVGSFSTGGDKYGLLVVGDTSYLKPPPGTLAGPDATKALKEELDARWIVNDGDLGIPVESLVNTPQEYADQLRSAVAVGTVPTPDGPAGDLEIDGAPAQWASTPAGAIYVSKEPPYEVLRVDEPTPGPAPSSTAGAASGAAPEATAGLSAMRVATQLEASDGDDGTGEAEVPDVPDGPSAVTELSQGEVDAMFDEMLDTTKQLKNAVDPSIDFELGGDGQAKCSSGGCSANVRVTSGVSATSGTVKGGTANGQLVVNFTVDGRSAGTCSTSSSLPLKGSTSMGCSAAGAGGVYAAVEAQKKAEAKSKSQACRCSVRYSVPYNTDWQVVALADVRIEVLRSELGDRRKALMDQGKFCSFAGSTPVLMGDGTRQPIQDVEVGDEVWAADPVTGEKGAREVTHTWVHQDELFELEIDGETILTTEDHPFWSATDQRFERADELGVGELVRGADGRTITVIDSPDLDAHYFGQAYNLTVADLGTFHVSDSDVLVHNTGRLGRGDDIGLGQGYTGRLDRFGMGKGTDFEIHVYHGKKEVGIFGSNGWFPKHRKDENVTVPASVETRLKGKAISEMRANGRIGPRGTTDVTGDNWKRPRLTGGCS